jgi:2-haloacid dehalogenase
MNRRQLLSMTAGATLLGLAGSNSLINSAAADVRRSEIKAIAFDGFPIFDPRPILVLTKKLYPEQGEAFGKMWFNKIFAYTWLRTNGGKYKNFYAVLNDALIYTATRLKVGLSPDKRDQLMGIWLQLKPWPDVGAALQVFKNQGVRLAFLSNLTEEMLRINTKNAGIEDEFEFYLSTDSVSAFKPHPRAYQMGVDAFNLPKKNIAFAAFGSWDAAGASWFGYPTIWVNRFGLPAENLDAGIITTGRDITTLVDFVK